MNYNNSEQKYNFCSGGKDLSKKDIDIKIKTSIGGQALIEGIMMKGPKKTAMAVRNPKGEIVVEEEDNVVKGGKFSKLPFIRGVFGFVNSMKSGYKYLMRSAEISGFEAVEEDDAKDAEVNGAENTVETPNEVLAENGQAEEKPSENIEKEEKDATEKEEKGSSGALMTVAMAIGSVLGIALAIGLFIVMPSYLFKWLTYLIPALKPDSIVLSSLYKSVFEGVLRIVILIAYMALVSLMKDIRRTFEYHGAEHKTIFCYEKGLELTVGNVRKQRRFHPRCGTSFLILMVLVGILISFLIDPLCILIFDGVPPTILRVAIKLCLIPIIMGVGYELLKLAGRHDNILTRIISAPGMWLQHITVREPDDSMIECAITAVKRVIPDDESDRW